MCVPSLSVAIVIICRHRNPRRRLRNYDGEKKINIYKSKVWGYSPLGIGAGADAARTKAKGTRAQTAKNYKKKKSKIWGFPLGQG